MSQNSHEMIWRDSQAAAAWTKWGPAEWVLVVPHGTVRPLWPPQQLLARAGKSDRPSVAQCHHKIIIIAKNKKKSWYQWANKLSVDKADKSVLSAHTHTVNIVHRGTHWWHASTFTRRSVCAGYVALISYRFDLSYNIKNKIFTRPSWKKSLHIDSTAPRRRFISAETFICTKYITVNEIKFSCSWQTRLFPFEWTEVTGGNVILPAFICSF